MSRIDRHSFVAALGWSLALAADIGAQAATQDTLRRGPHHVGFRVIEAHDRSRVVAPVADHEGRTTRGERSVPVQLAVWFPARAGTGSRLTTHDLLVASAKKERFGRATRADSSSARDEFRFARTLARVDTTLPQAAEAIALSRRTHAFRGATPAAGSWPVVVIGSSGAIANVMSLGEHLASHGWLVVATPSRASTAAREVTAPRLAIDERVRDLGFAIGTAYDLPGADLDRLALLGVNFDSYAAIELQLRQMGARAVVTINGWQTIETRAAHLRASAWFDVNRLRVPMLNLHWDEANAAPANLAFLEELRYADRSHAVISGLDHFGLTSDPLRWTFTAAPTRASSVALVNAVTGFLEHAVRPAGLASTAAGTAADTARDSWSIEAAVPASLLKSAWTARALPAVPTRDEFVTLLWDAPDLPRAARILREAKAANPRVQLFGEQDLRLYVFRYTRTGRPAEAVAVARLMVEGHPGSAFAHAVLADALRAQGDSIGGRQAQEAADRLRRAP